MANPMTPPPHAPDFLAASGWAGAEILPLAGDASFRRYFRVVHGNRTAVLMDAPPPHEDPQPFIAVAEWLIGHGLSAPEILARDLDRGLLLLGDFGSERLRETLDDDPRRERELYELATDVLVHLHDNPPMPGLKPHGLDQWLEELALFTDWYCPAVGAAVDAAGYQAAWREVLEPIANDGEKPTFDNTIVALERTGRLLDRAEATLEPVAEDGDQLEAEQRLDTGQHHARFVERLLQGVLDRFARFGGPGCFVDAGAPHRSLA